jgi:hypothetical protein
MGCFETLGRRDSGTVRQDVRGEFYVLSGMSRHPQDAMRRSGAATTFLRRTFCPSVMAESEGSVLEVQPVKVRAV